MQGKLALDNERKESAEIGGWGLRCNRNITSRVADTFEGFDNTSDFRRDGFSTAPPAAKVAKNKRK